jgi:hypothetical protein
MAIVPHVDTPQGICQIGIARGDITPPVGAYHRMWGAATHDRSTDIHRPLTATALALKATRDSAEGDGELLVIDVDHCLLWAPEMEMVLDAIRARTGLSRHQIVVAFTHTHGSGLMDLTRRHLPGGELIEPYLRKLAAQLADLAVQARAHLKEAFLTYGTGRCDLAAERDFSDEQSGQIVCGFNPLAEADDTVLIVRASDCHGKKLATIVNYACHPTTLAWENTKVSPDFVGSLREVVEGATGAPCVFLQGASGDLGPREGFVGDTAVADRNGRRLGYAVLSALESMAPAGTSFRYRGAVISGATLGPWDHVPLAEEDLSAKRFWRHKSFTVPLPYRPEIPKVETVQAERAV